MLNLQMRELRMQKHIEIIQVYITAKWQAQDLDGHSGSGVHALRY